MNDINGFDVLGFVVCFALGCYVWNMILKYCFPKKGK
jgi:hypothetical protein